MRPHFNSVFDSQINNRDLFDLNFVINRKVISLHNEIKYVKRSESSFDDFSAKYTPSATLMAALVIMFAFLSQYKYFVISKLSSDLNLYLQHWQGLCLVQFLINSKITNDFKWKAIPDIIWPARSKKSEKIIYSTISRCRLKSSPWYVIRYSKNSKQNEID